MIRKPGWPETALVLLVSGTVRVQTSALDGDAQVLYRISAGNHGDVTRGTLFPPIGQNADAVAETDIETVIIPRPEIRDVMQASKDFRALVFRSYCQRMADMLQDRADMGPNPLDPGTAEKLTSLTDPTGWFRAVGAAASNTDGTASWGC